MSDSYLPLLKAIIATLKADAPVGAVVGDRIYTDVPQNEVFPYMVVSIDSSPYDANDFTGMEHTPQINTYSRDKSPYEAASARAAVYDALNRQGDTIALDTGRIVDIQYTGVGTVFKDTDGVTWTSVAQFRAVVT